ncbi:MAG: hypothetical protein ACRD9R_12005, partial [Pyrinomonadaceae bacterium]
FQLEPAGKPASQRINLTTLDKIQSDFRLGLREDAKVQSTAFRRRPAEMKPSASRRYSEHSACKRNLFS